ncbi:MAG: TonB-dependent receptor [Myxococcales bacterium]
MNGLTLVCASLGCTLLLLSPRERVHAQELADAAVEESPPSLEESRQDAGFAPALGEQLDAPAPFAAEHDAGAPSQIRAAGADVTSNPTLEGSLESARPIAPLEVTVRSLPTRPEVHAASDVTRKRETLLAAPHRTAADMLVTVPGLFLTQHSGEGKAYQIFYRGFDAVHGQDLELWVGGAPVNDVSNVHGQGYADLNFVMPEVVQTLRATPGTYDPRQGDFAVAGTVRLDLGYEEEGISAKAGYGSFGTQRYFLGYRPKGSNEKTFAAGEVYTTDGFGPSRAAQRASAIAQGSMRLDHDIEARVLLTTYAGHFDSAGVLRLEDIQSGARSRFATYDPNQGGASTRSQIVAEVKREGHDSEFSVAPYFVLRTLRLRQNFTGYLEDPSGDSQQQLNDDMVLGGTAFYRLRQRIFSERDTLEVGVSMRSDWIEQSQRRLATADQSVTAELVHARVRASDVAGYFDAALHPFSRVTLHGGVRFDGLFYGAEDLADKAAGAARSSMGTHFGKKASLEVRLFRGLAALASYGEGFRSPQVRSLAESEATPFTRVVSFEAGLRYANPYLQASMAGFRTALSDDLVFDQTTVRNERVPATLRVGATADASLSPLPWVHLNLNGTFTKASFPNTSLEHRAGDLVPYTPQLVTRGDLGLTPVFGEWRRRKLTGQFGLGSSYMTRRPLPYGQFGHHIFLVDAQAGLRWGEGAVLFRAFNLFDAHWYDGEYLFASNWDPGQAAPMVPNTRQVTVGAPRTLFVSLELYL